MAMVFKAPDTTVQATRVPKKPTPRYDVGSKIN